MSRPAHGISDEQVLQVIACPMEEPNDAGVKTVGQYLAELLAGVIEDQESFDGKRPFGYSGWYYTDLLRALVQAKIVDGRLDEDGDLQDCDWDRAGLLIHAAIAAMPRLALLSAAPRRPT